MADESRGLRINNKVAVVTGGCNGIGRSIVDVLVEHGGKIVVLDIDDATGKTLSTDRPSEIYFIHCDTTKEEDVKKAIGQTVNRFGQIDLLVNDAGRISSANPIDGTTAEDFLKLLNLNVMGYFLMCKYALPHIRKTKGSVVNISSITTIGARNCTPYATTKGAVSAMTRSLAVDEAKHGVRINAISPGVILTPLFASWRETLEDKIEADKLEDLHLLRRFGQPREIGLACLFLATDATFSTGIDLSCSGGMEFGLGDKYY